MELLAALLFGLIIFGFTAVMLIPLAFAWLAYAVFREPWHEAFWRRPVVYDPISVEHEAEIAATEPLPPKVMVAGRRRPAP